MILDLAQEFWNKWTSPQKAAEIYARTVSNLADNTIVTTRIGNNAMFANMEASKTIVVLLPKEQETTTSSLVTQQNKRFINIR